jgi:hypothetical protein
MMSAHLGVASLAKIAAPLVSGYVLALSSSLSICVSCVIFFVAFALAPLVFKQEAQQGEGLS